MVVNALLIFKQTCIKNLCGEHLSPSSHDIGYNFLVILLIFVVR